MDTAAAYLIDLVVDTALRKGAERGWTPAQIERYTGALMAEMLERTRVQRPDLYDKVIRDMERLESDR